MSRQQSCAAGIVLDDRGRLLVIRRGREPARGRWSVPGGRRHPDEPAVAACVREVAEETGMAVDVVRWVGRVELDAPDGGTFVIDDFLCRPVGGELRAGDDADDARWVTRTEFAELSLSPGLWDALERWQVLPS